MKFRYWLVFLLISFIAKPALSLDSDIDKTTAYEQHYPEISYTQLRKAIDAGQIFLIDANSTKTFKNGHIPLAKSLYNRDQLTAQLPVLKNYPIAVYCGGPQCSAWHKAADFAAAKGYTSIMHFEGGLKGWKDQGNPLASEQD